MGKTANEAIGRHVTRFFRGHEAFLVDLPPDAVDRVPGLEVLEVRPGPRSELFSYVTLGAFAAIAGQREGLEFVLSTVEADTLHAQTVATAAAFHCATTEHRLSRGSVVPLHRPWAAGSACDRLLVTLPYPYGPEFEFCHWGRNLARLLWLIPITAEEEEFASLHGVDALEHHFEDAGVRVADPTRESVV